MLLRNEAKVGLIVVIAIIALIAIYWFLGGWSLKAGSYPVYTVFPDARKLDKGADVRMAGVKVGLVSGISLTQASEARIDMVIWVGTHIPEGSVTRITTGSPGGFIGDNYVEIVPGREKTYVKPGEMIPSAHEVQVEQLIDEAGELLKDLRATAKGINSIVCDKEVVGAIKDTLKTLKLTAQSASEMVESARATLGAASPRIEGVFANMDQASQNAVRVSEQLNDILAKDARPNLKAIMGQAQEAMCNLNSSIVEARHLITTFGQSAAGVSQVMTNLTEVSEQAQQMMTKLNEASNGIRDIATDEELQADLRATMRNAACATEQAKELMTGLNRKYGLGKTATPEQKSAIPGRGTSVDTLWNTGTGNYRFDANYTHAKNDNEFYRIGARDIGEKTGANLQLGVALDQRNAFRYGLYASRVGLGYDYRPNGRLTISAELFRPNEPELELRGILGLRNGFGLYGGVGDVLHKDGRDILLGLRYAR